MRKNARSWRIDVNFLCTTSSNINIGHPQERVVKKVSEKKGWARGTKNILSG